MEPAEVEPESAKIALTDPGWKKAMEEELQAMKDKEVFELVDRPKGSMSFPTSGYLS